MEPTFWIIYVGRAIGWLVGLGAVGVGLWRRGESAVALLIPAGAPAIDHIPPFGVVAALGRLGAIAITQVHGGRAVVTDRAVS